MRFEDRYLHNTSVIFLLQSKRTEGCEKNYKT